MQSQIVISGVLSFLIGVGLRTVYEIPLEVVVWMLLLALGVGLVWRRNSEDVSAPYLLITSLVLFASSLGILRTEIASWKFNKS
ncbi:hypothetical protein KC865_03595, partial [Candidatus Kaiserbacteria bacterium]|nr:hypothetical protein [Candidatus Kaiserbacteria bacterium]